MEFGREEEIVTKVASKLGLPSLSLGQGTDRPGLRSVDDGYDSCVDLRRGQATETCLVACYVAYGIIREERPVPLWTS